MCMETQKSWIAIGGVPFSIGDCVDHAHGSATIGLPQGGALTLAADAPNVDQLVPKLGALLRDALTLSMLGARIGLGSLLVFSVSLVRPGKRIQALDPQLTAFADSLVDAFFNGDQSLVYYANDALRCMAPDYDKATRLLSESFYARLLSTGFARGLLVPILQRSANLQSAANTQRMMNGSNA